MKKMMRTVLAMLCAFAMLIPVCVFANGSETETTDSGDTITFGRYPQTEIVSQASDSGVYCKAWAAETDCIVDAGLYDILKNLSEDRWDANGDTTVNGIQYRRIRETDATYNRYVRQYDAAESSLHYDWSSSDTYHYFRFEPIQWRVLERTDSEAFLLSETVLDCRMYNSEVTGVVTWETCTVRSWLNGYDDSKNTYGTDYSSSNFIDTAFTSAEQKKIKTTALENKDNSKSGIEGGNDTNDKIYFLSEDEVYGSEAIGYGFAEDFQTNDPARQVKSSTYAKAMGVESNDLGNCPWWMRSPGSRAGLFGFVRASGRAERGGQHASSKSSGVLPAMHISLVDDANAYAVISAADGSVDYRTIVTLKVKATGMDTDSFLAIYEGEQQIAKGSAGTGEVTYYIGEMTAGKNYSVRIVDENGNTLCDGSGQMLQKDISVTVNAGLFKKIIAFFKDLFGLLPSKTIEP